MADLDLTATDLTADGYDEVAEECVGYLDMDLESLFTACDDIDTDY